MGKKKQSYRLIIRPAIPPVERHRIEQVLKRLKYKVWVGGTLTDLSACDIAFEK